MDAAILAQLRKGYCMLNAYLFKIGQVDSELCECGNKETVEHFLLECPRWDAHRKRRWKQEELEELTVTRMRGAY